MTVFDPIPIQRRSHGGHGGHGGHGDPGNRAEALAVSSPSAVQARAEDLRLLLELPARFIPELPEPVHLRLQVAGAPAAVCLATHPLAIDEVPLVLADTIYFDRAELQALIAAVEADRIWHREFLAFCFEKWRRPDFRLTLETALAGANPDAAVHWTFARVLQRLAASIERIETCERDHVSLHAAA